MKHFILTFSCIMFFIGCNKEPLNTNSTIANNNESEQNNNDDIELGPKLPLADYNALIEHIDYGDINIRILNASSYDVENYNFENVETFELLKAGDTTDYIQFKESYDRPIFQEMTIEGIEHLFHHSDNFGLSPLEPNKFYTYFLFIYETEQDDYIIGGKIYENEILNNFGSSDDCDELETTLCSEDVQKINIRIKNSTAFDFCDFVFKPTADNSVMYGNIASGETTCYVIIDEAKDFPYLLNFTLGDDEYTIENQSFFVGENDLFRGKFTYHIFIAWPDIQFAYFELTTD